MENYKTGIEVIAIFSFFYLAASLIVLQYEHHPFKRYWDCMVPVFFMSILAIAATSSGIIS